MPISEREKQIRLRLRDDFAHYAEKCLKIRPKEGGIVPFCLNQAQLYIHQRLQAQMAEKGMARAIILKGRQQGCSTYIEGRFFWRTTHRHGCRAMILTHMQDATDNLFGMVSRYYENCPELVRPHRGTSNTKELIFDRLDSSYRASTAGSKGAGRSETVQLFHGSEAAFWPNADEHLAGALQAVPSQPGTEIIIESTANGIGNAFHRLWQQAEAGQGDFEAIFVPWFWQDEYRRPVDDDFELDDDEIEYAEAHGCDLEQMAWRRAKITELGNDPLLFKREYPATAAEAFEESSEDTLIKYGKVLAAARTKLDEVFGQPLIIGLDPAGEGEASDRTAIIRRRGRKMFGKERHMGKSPMQIVGLAAKILKDENPAKMFIDIGERGHGIVDRLHELGYRNQVVGVGFGERAVRSDVYINKRAEMWGDLRDWLEEEGQVEIPDDQELHADLVAPFKTYNSQRKLVLESKEKMKDRGVRSPDFGDAAALTFAYAVSQRLDGRRRKGRVRAVQSA